MHLPCSVPEGLLTPPLLQCWPRTILADFFPLTRSRAFDVYSHSQRANFRRLARAAAHVWHQEYLLQYLEVVTVKRNCVIVAGVFRQKNKHPQHHGPKQLPSILELVALRRQRTLSQLENETLAGYSCSRHILVLIIRRPLEVLGEG